jgi:arylsulfatase A-like enzyme/Tfp pilus assembly protein PilF
MESYPKFRAMAVFFILFCLFCPVLVRCVVSSPAPPEDTNVLLITVDTLRYDRISILSDKYVRTPHIDDLARRSVIFTRAYAHNSLTRPSHANILTGTTPLYHGVSDNPGFKLESRYLTLTEYLKADRYRTAAFIGNFILDHRFGLDKGFDLYDDRGFIERTAEQVIRPAMQWISGQPQKWFCWIHLFDPHDPYAPPSPFKEEYAKDPYSGEVAYVDAQLGVLFDALEKDGQLRKTIVILTSDHGEAFGEKGEDHHGFFVYNNTLHVPLILFYPGVKPKTVRENACHVDIFPTVCDLLKLPIPSPIQGESLLPLVAGKPRQKKLIYFESMSPHFFIDGAPLMGFIRDDLKFIDQPIKEVYDLSADFEENNNLAPSADIPRFLGDLERLKKSLAGTGTTQDLEGRDSDILPLLKSLGYISGTPTKRKSYGPEDDLKNLWPLIARMHQAVAEFESGKRDSAIDNLAAIVRVRPIYVTARSALADAYYKSGRIDQALSTLKEGLAKSPENGHLLSRLGIIAAMAKRYGESIEPLELAVKKDKYNPDNFNYLGLAYMKTDKFSRAEDQFKKALELKPDLVAALNNLGYLYLTLYIDTAEEKYYDLSLRNFDQALTLDPNLEIAKKGREAAVNRKIRKPPATVDRVQKKP